MRRREEQEAADLRRAQLLRRDAAAAGRPEPFEPVAIPLPGRHSRGRGDQEGWLARCRDRFGWWPDAGPGHVAVVAIGVAVAMAVLAWIVIASAPRAVPAPAAHTSPGTGSASPLALASVAPVGAPASSPIVVDVTGRVRHRGIVRLPAGSRVIDALRRAGGARPGADLSSLNLARPLTDGEQIVVGRPAVQAPAGAGSGPGPSAGPATRVSLNAATLEQLDTLPGVGPVTAQKILDWRTEHGRFSTVDELLEVDGIGTKTMADIAPHVTL